MKRRRLLPMLAAAGVLAVSLVSIGAGQARVATCDTWIGGVDNNFGTAGNWSTGFVPGAGDDACIDGAGTYTVIANGSFSVHSLTLGGPSGTQVLVIPADNFEFALGAASTVNTNGALTLGDAGSGYSLLASGATLTNSGHLNTV